MVAVPAAIIIVNDDLAPSTRSHLIRQLFINSVLDGYTFDSYVAADDQYVNKLKQLNQRVMVVRTFQDRDQVPTWTLADVVVFIKQGLAAIEINKFGPHGLTLPVLHLYWGALGIH